MTALREVRARALASLVPPERLPLSEWIEANIRLPQATTAIPGPMKLWPYQRAIADSIADPAVERVTLLKAARISFTSLLTAATGHFVANEPSPILCLEIAYRAVYRSRLAGRMSIQVG